MSKKLKAKPKPKKEKAHRAGEPVEAGATVYVASLDEDCEVVAVLGGGRVDVRRKNGEVVSVSAADCEP